MMDTMYFKSGIHGISSPITVSGGGGIDPRPNPSQITAVGRSPTAGNSMSVEKSTAKATPFGNFSFKYPFRSLWPNRQNGIAIDEAVLAEENEAENGFSDPKELNPDLGPTRNWVLKILDVGSMRNEQRTSGGDELVAEERKMDGGDEACSCCDDDDDENCTVDYDEIELDRDSFSKMLRRVSLTEAKLYAQMSYLGNLAYCISKIKPANLLKNHGLSFVTSSVAKKEQLMKSEENETSSSSQEVEEKPEETVESKEQRNTGDRISASAAYEIAASAAYLHFHTQTIFPFNSSNTEEGGCEGKDDGDMMNPEVASFMATTDSVTAVVAAKEEVKQAVADDLNSTHSTPCEWFICDDDQSMTRFFVIQGSESLASWQANLLFEPIKFEGLDVIVHRGIYEAAKGIYEQMLPEVKAHLKTHGNRALFRFTGHSLGGSLSVLVNLMLLIRGEVPKSSLLPVVTFGSPSIMCGGDSLLHKLGLPRSHVQAVTMHRDIVPRAFSCNYPNHVAEFLKALNKNFRNHPCLNNQKVLYAPMGELLILQPEDKVSPHHHLLPSGNGLYLLTCPISDLREAKKQLRAAQSAFFNSPHPLEILSDRSAYGSEGTIHRDHDMNTYLKAVRGVIRKELNSIRKAKREDRRKAWWPLVGAHVGPMYPNLGPNLGRDQINFSGMVKTGTESVKRFSRFVASQHMHLLVIFLLPNVASFP